MVRKNQDEKKLKLNQPILSVRRSGKDDKREIDDSLNSVPQPTLYRSESKLDPVRSPGVVPFVWEESPGKPKDGIKLQNNPRGRSTKTNQQCFDKAVERLGVRNGEEEENLRRGLQCVQPSEKLIRKLGSFNSSKRSVEDYEISEAGDDDEAYADSVDTLSKSKLVFLDCKAGSFKGSDEPDRTSPQTRDFMIGLFLPATKKMASEIPLYVPGKQAVVQELPRLTKNVAKADRRSRLQLEPSVAWHCYQSHDCDDEQASDDDENKHETFPAKVCGVVPRLCVRSSIFILNPVPAVNIKTRVHTSPGSRMQRYSFARSCTGVNDERSTSSLRKQKSMVGQKELAGNGISAYHSEPPQTYEMKAVLPTQGFAANAKKFSKKLQELLADHSNSMREDSGNHVPEKTLHMVESPVLESDSPVTKMPSQMRKGDDNVALTMKRQHKPMVDFSFRDAGDLHVADERAKTKPFVQETVDFDLLTSAYEFSVKSGRNPMKAYRQDHNRCELTITSVESDSEVDESSIKQEALTRKLKHSEDMMHLEFPASPPLPKSPSDSWLFRTLPSLSTKSSPLRPYLGSENQRDPTSEHEQVKTETEMRQE